jgi:hypothetical protein
MKFVFILMLLVPGFSYGYLGEIKTSSGLQSVQNNATYDQSYTTTQYTKDNVVITEYQNQSGKVFAVSWTGMSHPDLSTLLGSYWPNYKKQKRVSQRRKNKRVVSNSTLVVEKGGRMREVFGKAYDSSLLPEGFDVNEL